MDSENIIITKDLTTDLASIFSTKKYTQVVVLVDGHTLKFCYPLIQELIPDHAIIEVPAGEENKNLETCSHIWQGLTELAVDRHGALLILGGGVLGDMGGFCAATYKRGVDFILVPTTLLSQVDSSIGGKLGIDFMGFKNHIGVFQKPACTVLHDGFLKTLSAAELRSGFAEVIKHVLLSDKALWETLRHRDLNQQDWHTLISHSVAFKKKVVEEDPREMGLRKILNAGHTIGHAIESFFLEKHDKVMHGEAVAAGLVCECHLAVQRGMLDTGTFDKIRQYILTTFGKIRITENYENSIAELVLQDKKNKGKRILSVLLADIGKPQWDVEISLDEVKGALSFYRSAQM